MQRIGIYGAARGLGSTLLAAHLYYSLREHGVRCSASSSGFRGGRTLGLARWTDISTTPGKPACFQTESVTPLGLGVHVLDLHAELIAAELDENACDSWVILIRDEASLLDYWMFFFDPITPSTALVVTDLPPFHAGDLTVTIEPAGDIAACGTLAVGELVAVGRVQYGARIGLTDYSRKTTDEWGVTAVVERGYAKRFEPSVLIPASAMDYVARRFAEIRATPVIWVGVAQYESTVIYGWLRDWGINITYPTYVQASVTIEGLS